MVVELPYRKRIQSCLDPESKILLRVDEVGLSALRIDETLIFLT